jgi:general secretion pathway protein H
MANMKNQIQAYEMIFQNRNRLFGFTLMELLIVMAIMAMAMAIVIPRMSSGEVVILQAQVREVMALFRYARRSAIVEGKPKIVLLYQGKSAETAQKTSSRLDAGSWRSREVTLQWSEQSLLQKEASEEQDNEDNENTEAQTYKVTFYPEGGSSGGELILIYKEKFKAKIKINPITGKVTSDTFENEEED